MPPDDVRRHRAVHPPEIVTSPGNQVAKLIRSLGQRRRRDQLRQAVVEGDRAVADALAAGAVPVAIVLREGYEPATPPIATAVGERPDLIRHFDTALFESCSDTLHPQGVMAVVQMPDPVAIRVDATLILLLDGIRDPGNMGTLLRSAAAAGADAVVIGPGSVDAWNPKAIRAGMGAQFRVPIVGLADLSDGWADSFPRRAIAEAGAARTYDEMDWREATLLIVGSEADGPSETGRSLANLGIRIPMTGGIESLNAAVAGSVILFEIARQRRSAYPAQPK